MLTLIAVIILSLEVVPTAAGVIAGRAPVYRRVAAGIGGRSVCQRRSVGSRPSRRLDRSRRRRDRPANSRPSVNFAI